MRIDSHHHFWDTEKDSIDWLKEDALAPINRPFRPDDMRPLLTAATIDRTVLVQTIHDLQETREFLAIADTVDYVAGVVGWADLLSPDLPATLAALRAAPGGDRLVGIRHLVHNEPDPHYLARPDVMHGVGQVGQAGLVYDLLLKEPNLDSAIVCVDANPDMRFVIDHIAKPRIAIGATKPWDGSMADLAARPNVWCKLSGMVTEADWQTWTADDLAPYVARTIDMFGVDRVMFGSDWPVCLLAASYVRVVETLESLTAPLGPEANAKIFGRNAAELYGLRL